MHTLTKSFQKILLTASIAMSWSASLHAQTLFACEPEWAALTRVLLPQAQLHVATHSRQDPHHIEARPALIAQMRAADAAICTGAGLESGWLPTLQQRAGNPKVQNGQTGMFYAASAVQLINVNPDNAGNPFAGDVHAEGNPHFHTDPRQILKVAQAWGARLQQIYPEQQADIAERLATFQKQWQANLNQWESKAAILKGMPVAAQHTAYAYLWRWLDMKQIADLEPTPGLSPTPGHLNALLTRFRAENPPVAIAISSYQDPRSARWLTQQLGEKVPLLQLPATVENPDAPDALKQWFDQLITKLVEK